MIEVLAGLNGGIEFGRFQWPKGFISDVSVSLGSMQRVPWALHLSRPESAFHGSYSSEEVNPPI